MPYRPVVIGIICLGLTACSAPFSGPAQPVPATSAAVSSAPAAGMHRFDDAQLGLRIDYPADMAASTRFDSHYLANADWKTYAGPNTTGHAVLMLTLPGSNEVTAAELRIGVSHAPREMARCDTPPSNAAASSIGSKVINGTTFATWHAADAGMSHYLKVHSYRVVRGGYCYAIDLLVIGTDPQVYAPPRTPPFGQQAAFAQLQKVLQGFRFMH